MLPPFDDDALDDIEVRHFHPWCVLYSKQKVGSSHFPFIYLVVVVVVVFSFSQHSICNFAFRCFGNSPYFFCSYRNTRESKT